MITPEKAIEALNKKIETLQGVHNSKEFGGWQSTAVNTLSNIYSESDERIKKFGRIRAFGLYSRDDYTQDAKREAKEILDSIISDIEHFGIPNSSKDDSGKGVSVNVNQSNNQTQSTNISINLSIILDAVKGELRASEIEELKEIIESPEEPKEKKKNFMDKIKSFGSDVASNILANILTNPQVYEQLGKNLY